jgi:hypothetical protein
MINRPNPAGVQIECGRCPNRVWKVSKSKVSKSSVSWQIEQS